MNWKVLGDLCSIGVRIKPRKGLLDTRGALTIVLTHPHGGELSIGYVDKDGLNRYTLHKSDAEKFGLSLKDGKIEVIE